MMNYRLSNWSNYLGSGMGPWGMSGYWGWGNSWGAQLTHSWFFGYWWLAVLVFGVLLVWSLAWKGLALWKAARNRSAIWFVVLLLVNTLGILDILYIFVFSKKGKSVEK